MHESCKFVRRFRSAFYANFWPPNAYLYYNAIGFCELRWGTPFPLPKKNTLRYNAKRIREYTSYAALLWAGIFSKNDGYEYELNVRFRRVYHGYLLNGKFLNIYLRCSDVSLYRDVYRTYFLTSFFIVRMEEKR